MVGAAGDSPVAGQVRKAGVQVRQRLGGGKHHIRLGFQEAPPQPEQAEGVLAGHLNLSRLKDAAAGQVGLDAPGARLVPNQGDTPSGSVAGQVGYFLNLQPGLGQAEPVNHLYLSFQVAAHLTTISQTGQTNLQSLQVNPSPEKADAQNQGNNIKKTIKERESSAQGIKSYHGQQD